MGICDREILCIFPINVILLDMPVNMRPTSSRFRVEAVRVGIWGMTQKLILSDFIVVESGDRVQREITSGVLDATWLNVKHYADGGARVELDDPPRYLGPIVSMVSSVRRDLGRRNGMEEACNINFPWPRHKTTVEIPLAVGSVRVDIERVT